MGDKSNIGWTDATWPIVQGCDYVSPGCTNCYAPREIWRQQHAPNPKVSLPVLGLVEKKGDNLVWTGKVALREDRLDWPLRWTKPRMIFVPSLGDLFHEDVPSEFIHKVFTVMALCPQHTFQVLTKRPERLIDILDATRAFGFGNHYGVYVDYAHEILGVPEGTIDETISQRIKAAMDEGLRVANMKCGTCLPNVWLGASVEDRKRLDRPDHLRAAPAVVRFLSIEPQLEDLGRIDLTGIHWLIAGGESGPHARPYYVNWADDLRDQCQAAGVPFFMKQLGSNVRCIDDEFGDVPITLKHPKGADPAEWPEDLRVQQFPTPPTPRMAPCSPPAA